MHMDITFIKFKIYFHTILITLGLVVFEIHVPKVKKIKFNTTLINGPLLNAFIAARFPLYIFWDYKAKKYI